MNTNTHAVPVLSKNESWFADGRPITLIEAVTLAKGECNFTSDAYEAMKVHLKKAEDDAAEVRRADILLKARGEYQREGEIEIDDNAEIGESEDNGVYVAAWVWVSFEGSKYDKENEIPYELSKIGTPEFPWPNIGEEL
jgi:hypothetical protein